MLGNIIRVGISNLFLLIRIAVGNKIRIPIISLINPCATIRTLNGGKITFGNKCAIRANSEVRANGCSIIFGNNCFVNKNCMIVAHKGVVFEDNVTIGPGCYIFDHDHGKNGIYISKQIVLEKNVWVGAGSIILKGVTVGHDSIIAAGSIITRDVAPYSRVIQRRAYI